jgi:hypothetical protein
VTYCYRIARNHIEGEGPTVFAHACKLGLEGIVSKRKDSPYRSGRSPDWLKSKKPACAAVKRGGGGGLEEMTEPHVTPKVYLVHLRRGR